MRTKKTSFFPQFFSILVILIFFSSILTCYGEVTVMDEIHFTNPDGASYYFDGEKGGTVVPGNGCIIGNTSIYVKFELNGSLLSTDTAIQLRMHDDDGYDDEYIWVTVGKFESDTYAYMRTMNTTEYEYTDISTAIVSAGGFDDEFNILEVNQTGYWGQSGAWFVNITLTLNDVEVGTYTRYKPFEDNIFGGVTITEWDDYPDLNEIVVTVVDVDAEEEEEEEEETPLDDISDDIIDMLFGDEEDEEQNGIVVPLIVILFCAFLGYHFADAIGFIAGVNLGVMLSYLTLGFPAWTMIACIIIDVMYFFGGRE